MDKIKIDRINELARMAKERELSEEEKDEHSKKEVVLALKNMGVSKENLLSWIEEVYSK